MTTHKPSKKKTTQDKRLLNFVMPDGKRLRQCSPLEIEAVKRFVNDEATIGDLHNAGPSTSSLACQLALEVIRGVELTKRDGNG